MLSERSTIWARPPCDDSRYDRIRVRFERNIKNEISKTEISEHEVKVTNKWYKNSTQLLYTRVCVILSHPEAANFLKPVWVNMFDTANPVFMLIHYSFIFSERTTTYSTSILMSRARVAVLFFVTVLISDSSSITVHNKKTISNRV